MTKNLAEHGDKLDDKTKAEVQTALDEAKAVDAAADVETVKAKVSALSSSAMKIGQVMYQGQKGAEGQDAAASNNKEGAGAEEKAQEAEFDEKKK